MLAAAYCSGAALIEMQSSLKSVRLGLRQLMQTAQLGRIAEDTRSSVELVLAEVLNNVVEHAYRGNDGVIRLWVQLDGGTLRCQIEDEGLPLPGRQLPDPLLPDPSALAEGGFGWHLIRSLVADLAYQRLGAVNRLSFRVAPGQSSEPVGFVST